MKPASMAVLLAVLLALGAATASAQPVISAKSGVIAYVEGKVLLGDQALEYSVTKFPDIKENEVVRTEDGRAEILLTPGVILRLGENSSLKLLTNRLIDTRLEMLTGSAVVEADDIAKDTAVTIVSKNGVVALSKAGIYRFDSAPARLKVFKGLADVKLSGDTIPVGAGRMLLLDGTSASVQKFNTEETDALDHWSHRRGEYLALANVSAAKSLLDSGQYSPSSGWGLGTLGIGLGMNNCLNSWAFNQWYGMYTYMPCRGYMNSPYGYRFWSPFSVMRAYYVPPAVGRYGNGGFNGGGGFDSGVRGYSTAAATSSGYSGITSSAGSYSGSSAGSSSGVSAGASGGGVSSAGGAGGGGHGGSSGGGGGGGGHH
jgi:hypothetical protein